ncbi:hypothetical protein C8F04DRAFT_1343056 [Mycena alexandri]|uniref:Uncharacterized protein n=1 Tax=Mycena alexandri TaxID=1745969 RepID=A0AAD6S086_9AGAR|nr:hypothetical protein C8F04DRAFT_1343056 [Mycena alexandri]
MPDAWLLDVGHNGGNPGLGLKLGLPVHADERRDRVKRGRITRCKLKSGVPHSEPSEMGPKKHSEIGCPWDRENPPFGKGHPALWLKRGTGVLPRVVLFENRFARYSETFPEPCFGVEASSVQMFKSNSTVSACLSLRVYSKFDLRLRLPFQDNHVIALSSENRTWPCLPNKYTPHDVSAGTTLEPSSTSSPTSIVLLPASFQILPLILTLNLNTFSSRSGSPKLNPSLNCIDGTQGYFAGRMAATSRDWRGAQRPDEPLFTLKFLESRNLNFRLSVELPVNNIFLRRIFRRIYQPILSHIAQGSGEFWLQYHPKKQVDHPGDGTRAFASRRAALTEVPAKACSHERSMLGIQIIPAMAGVEPHGGHQMSQPWSQDEPAPFSAGQRSMWMGLSGPWIVHQETWKSIDVKVGSTVQAYRVQRIGPGRTWREGELLEGDLGSRGGRGCNEWAPTEFDGQHVNMLNLQAPTLEHATRKTNDGMCVGAQMDTAKEGAAPQVRVEMQTGKNLGKGGGLAEVDTVAQSDSARRIRMLLSSSGSAITLDVEGSVNSQELLQGPCKDQDCNYPSEVFGT